MANQNNKTTSVKAQKLPPKFELDSLIDNRDRMLLRGDVNVREVFKDFCRDVINKGLVNLYISSPTIDIHRLHIDEASRKLFPNTQL